MNTNVPPPNVLTRSGQLTTLTIADGTCPICGTLLPLHRSLGEGPIAERAAMPQPIAAALLRTGTLSLRERTIFQLLGYGYDNRSLARMLTLSERTVKRHITAILSKLQLESRLQAGLAALITFSRVAAECDT